ncbi:unnamed protein product [Adineta steineri]|uniref:Uncharacterized protein n=2 Tax=Adineta steineri TaxID=433720 RepID=A0A819CHT4_9BILA|nr:unnamed protein product [Adineta steineri]
MPSSDKAKQDLLHFARVYYTDNDLELQRINNFDTTYKPSEALKWYSSDSFVYRLLNKAIRTENIDLLFACRFFITDLHHQLESLHKPYVERICSYDLDELLVYHGQQMTSDDFNKLKANIGELISINSFLSTSLDRQVALIYAGDKRIHPTMESVLFKIKININENSETHQHPFASISEFSRFDDEQEVLFSLSSMFRIESIDEQLDQIWIVNMVFIESTSETEEMIKLSTHLRIDPIQTTTIADLAYLLLLMGDYNRTISFCQTLLKEVSNDYKLIIRCYNIMGQAYINEPESALQSYENALKLQLQYDTTDFDSLATIYNNLGRVHRLLASPTHVIVDYYEKALKMCIAVSDDKQIDWLLMATITNNLVTAQPHADSDLNLEREQFVLDIRLKYLPLSHPLVASTYQVLTEIYSDRHDFEEAVLHSNEVLCITRKYLPNGHSSIAAAYYSAASLYLRKGDYEATQDQKEMSKKSYLKSLELNHQAFDIISSGELSSSINYSLMSALYNDCGAIYIRLARFDEALDCFNTATDTTLRYVPANDDLHGALLNNKGKVLTLTNNMSQGMEYYKLAIDFYKRTNAANSIRVPSIYFNIGEWYEISGTKDLAIAYYKRAIDVGSNYHKSNHVSLLQYMKALNKLQSTMFIESTTEEASWI